MKGYSIPKERNDFVWGLMNLTLTYNIYNKLPMTFQDQVIPKAELSRAITGMPTHTTKKKMQPIS